MRITTWAEYGLICSLHLARRSGEGPVTGRDIATQERLPADYVEQILLRLRRAGIVASTRGARGGSTASRPGPAQATERTFMPVWTHSPPCSDVRPQQPSVATGVFAVRCPVKFETNGFAFGTQAP